jgi:signal transduction histidine kinase
MSWHRRFGAGRPPWWPANETWPPADRGRLWRRRRGFFVRRIALAFVAMLFLSALGMSSLLSIVTGRGTSGTGLPAGVALGSMVLLMGLVVAIVRRVGVPLGDIVEGARRLEAGELSTRVALRGSGPIRMVGGAFNSMAARLEAQDRQRRELMADIAHELRTPLTVIQGRLEGVLDGVYPLDTPHLTEVLEETRLLSRLVDDLRTLANAESGTLTLQKEPADVVSLCQDAVSSMSAESSRRQVVVRLDASSDLPLICVDPLRIREVLVNLLSNAIHHSPAGGDVSLTARCRDGRVSLAVADTGAGISAEDLPRIFDRFYKGPESRGSGLGLAISRNLVSAHGGDIRAESTPGAGTTIVVTLPAGKNGSRASRLEPGEV